MKKFCIVLIFCMVIVGVVGCGSNYDPEVDRDIQLTTNSTYTDVKEMSTEVTEIKAKTHLEDMFEITRNLSYDDIRLLKKNKENKESGKNINIEKEQKERQE